MWVCMCAPCGVPVRWACGPVHMCVCVCAQFIPRPCPGSRRVPQTWQCRWGGAAGHWARCPGERRAAGCPSDQDRAWHFLSTVMKQPQWGWGHLWGTGLVPTAASETTGPRGELRCLPKPGSNWSHQHRHFQQLPPHARQAQRAGRKGWQWCGRPGCEPLHPGVPGSTLSSGCSCLSGHPWPDTGCSLAQRGLVTEPRPEPSCWEWSHPQSRACVLGGPSRACRDRV